MQRGDIVDGRFEVRRTAGKGGISMVYRAMDRDTGQRAAVKVLRHDDEQLVARFTREAEVLSQLRHDGIVKYIAHGRTDGGVQYLAMEWLEGEDLARRLRRTRLSVAECIALTRRVAASLAYAHAHGIIHQDIKPGNLFLPRGRVDDVKIVDFGAARLGRAETDIRLAHHAMGTPAYMSPEQARGEAELDPRTDVFALGCVLFQCLTQRRPFFGSDPIALVAKILLEEPPGPRKLEPNIPVAIDRLVMRMLAKDPLQRPADGAAVVAAIDELGPIEQRDDDTRPIARALTQNERSLHSMVMAKGIDAHKSGQRLAALVEDHGAHVEMLSDDAFVVAVTGTDAATDLAGRAARCALALRALAPDASFALATGRELLGANRASVGSLIDRATRLLRQADAASLTQETRALTPGGDGTFAAYREAPIPRQEPADEPQAGAIRLDDVTAGLLDSRFEVTTDVTGPQLYCERPHGAGVRTLLAKPTSCVGREAELSTLLALFRVCVDESEACIVRVTAPVGFGKTRLLHELLRRLEQSGARFQLALGVADPLSAGTPFGSLAVAIRRACGVLYGEPLAVQRDKLRRRIERSGVRNAERVAAFIGEMVGVAFSDHDNVQLRAARHDALLMRDQLRRAWVSWLEAECARSPTILVLDDMHWGDLPTVDLVDTSLQTLQDAPLMVVAMARPEIDEVFLDLWADRGVHHIHLGGLSKKASLKLAREVLGEDTSEDTIADIIERAAGNAFYLEELLRAAAEGETLQLPETVLAMVQARLERLDANTRRVLRAASVYGRAFWRGSLDAMLGDDWPAAELDRALALLEQREVIKRSQRSKFPGEVEYGFRHDIIRDAAYAMLTESDVQTGHALAGAWLDRAGETEAVLLAEHFERGGQSQHAAGFYRIAAEQALLSNDFAAAFARAERGVGCGASGAELGALRLLQAEALNWQGEFRDAAECGLEAMRFLPRDAGSWYAAVGEIAVASGIQGDVDQLRDLGSLLGALEGAAALDARIWAATRLTDQLMVGGDIDAADRILALIKARAGDLDDRHPAIAARVYSAKAMRARFDGDTAAGMEHASRAAECFARAGDLRNACTERERAGYSRMMLGLYADSEATLRKVAERARGLGLQNVLATARHNLGLTISRLGNSDEGMRLELAAIDAFRASGNRRLEGASRTYLAKIFMSAGDYEAAEQHARLALDLAEKPTVMPLNRAQTLGVLAATLVAQGRDADALDAATAGLALLEELGAIDEGESQIRLAYAEAVHATGDTQAAKAAIAAAASRLRERAARIANPAWRESFLQKVPENARTLRLERDWT